ncbi:MAG: TetR family transcriptional regulator [Gorillibacterium sp.]|nr:TetR family transcriptional regulator [Gorillibacterium sp.]
MSRVVKAAGERKHEIIVAASALFIEKGYGEVPISEILDKVGIAKGTFYHYFSSKEELLSEILERRLQQIGRKADEIAAHEAMPAIEKLRSVMGIIFMSGRGQEGFVLDPTDERHLLMQMKLTNLFYGKLKPVLLAITVQGVKEGIFQTGDPSDITDLLLRGITSFTNQSFREMMDPGVAMQKIKSIGLVLTRVLGLPEDTAVFPVMSPQGEDRR